MTREINVFFQGYFPMWGLTFDSDDVGVIEEQVVVYVPDVGEWREVEKFDVFMERWRGSNPYSLDGPIPPTCLVTVAPIRENEDFQEAFDRLADPMMAQMQDAILALRLLKEGWFLDPDFSDQIFSLVGFNTRIVGPYRQAFLGGLHDLIPPPYHLSIDELLSMGELA